jgi:hypothetical protein
VRFFQQQGYTSSVAVSSSAIVTASSWLIKGLLFVIALPLAWSTIHLGEANEGGNSNTVWLILVVVIGVLVLVGLVLAVPKLRRLAGAKLRPRIQEVWGNARSVASSPRKVVLLIGGSIGGQLAVALALAASLRAFGDHLSLATLIVVMTLSSMIGGSSWGSPQRGSARAMPLRPYSSSGCSRPTCRRSGGGSVSCGFAGASTSNVYFLGKGSRHEQPLVVERGSVGGDRGLCRALGAGVSQDGPGKP